ncbi:MAG TPA: oxidoreductase [Solibacterales bacterium]|nr:oxidoreductase [Bryobacterales bacterium]
MKKEERLLRIGIVGLGPVSQAAHLEACRRGRNTELYAICDLADDLVTRMAALHQPQSTYSNFDRMLEDPRLEAVIVATSDAFHVPLAQLALAAGKHVFVEKPLGLDVEACMDLERLVAASGLVLQLGLNRRFDPALDFARRFVAGEVGKVDALHAWYCDSIARYTMTDSVQAIPVTSAGARREPTDDRARYLLLTHGSHLLDTAACLAGPIEAVQARRREALGGYLWSITIDFANGALGHANLIVPAAGDFEEGFQVFGEGGSVQGRLALPWYRKAGTVDCFSAREGIYRRPFGAEGDTYKLQLEAFADTILHGAPQTGATVADGVANLRALVATARSVESRRVVALSDVSGTV